MPYSDLKRQKEYQRIWIKKRRDDYFFDKICKDCGSTNSLEVHHLDPTIKVSHRIWSWSEKRRQIELKKCVILCVKCHDLRQYGVPEHGTYRMYRHHNCRCSLCRAANAAMWRNSNQAKQRKSLAFGRMASRRTVNP